MTLGERIRKVRKVLDLTQQEFADKIGSKRNTVATYEMGRTEPSAAVITLICRTFDVSENWLRTGEGEMLLAKPTAALDALAVEHSLSISDYTLIEKFLALKPESRKTITDLMMEVSASISTMQVEGTHADDPAFPSSVSHGIPRTMDEVDEQTDNFRSGLIMDIRHRQRQEATDKPLTIDEQVELYRQQLLLEKEQAEESSVSQSDTGSGTGKMA